MHKNIKNYLLFILSLSTILYGETPLSVGFWNVENLFDLENDPYEQKNLANTQTDIRNQLRQQLLKTLAETREPYFDVLIEHGVNLETPVINVSTGKHGGISPTWDNVIQTD